MLEVKNVSRKFNEGESTLLVLDDITFTINKGDKVALMGSSGSGKTTLLQIIGGLDKPTLGSVSINNTLIRGAMRKQKPESKTDESRSSDNEDKWVIPPILIKLLSFKRKIIKAIFFFVGVIKDFINLTAERPLAIFRRKNLGFIFQFHHLMTDFTAIENVYMPGLIAGESRKDGAKRAMELLKDVGIDHRAHHHPGELSGGERQRVALARALFNSPSLILADEPTGNLDRENREHFLALVDRLNKETGQTFLIATHDDEVAEAMDYRLILRDKKIYKES